MSLQAPVRIRKVDEIEPSVRRAILAERADPGMTRYVARKELGGIHPSLYDGLNRFWFNLRKDTLHLPCLPLCGKASIGKLQKRKAP